jgi:uncharacterized cupredoxin-like copper-binding protein
MLVRSRRLAVSGLIAIAMGGFAACSSDSSTTASESVSPASTSPTACESPDAGTGTPVGAAELDFSITLDTAKVKAGSTTFNVDNAGPSTHEFVVFATDLDPASLPIGSDGNVDEEGDGVTHIDEIEDIGAGCSATLTLDLDAGNYVVICNLPGHYAAGMHAPLVVK